MPSSFRLREKIEGVQWLGMDTSKEDAEWLANLPSAENNVKTVDLLGDKLMLTTWMTESVADPGDYVAIGGNGQPIVMPADLFEKRYEECDG